MSIERNYIALRVSLKLMPRVNPPLLLRDLIRTCSITKSVASPAQFISLHQITKFPSENILYTSRLSSSGYTYFAGINKQTWRNYGGL